MSSSSYTEIRLAKRPLPGAAVSEDCFNAVQIDVPSSLTTTTTIIKVKPLYFSVDPYLRCQFDENTGVDYVKPYQVSKPITSLGVGVVIGISSINNEKGESSEVETYQDPSHFSGETVSKNQPVMTEGMSWPWRSELHFSSSSDFTADSFFLPFSILKLLPSSVPHQMASHFLGVFGAPGLTAYFGILKESGLANNINDEESYSDAVNTKVVVISSAAGATGSIAAQLVKKHSKNPTLVIGISGSDAKGEKLLSLGICDKVINYKKAQGGTEEEKMNSMRKMIQEATQGQPIDMYFDSVGGFISNAIHREMKASSSKIVLCGQISTYNDASKNPDQEYPPPLSSEEKKILFEDRKVVRERYLVLKYAHEFGVAIQNLMMWVNKGELLPVETVYEPHGLENASNAFVAMMNGENFGKMVVKV